MKLGHSFPRHMGFTASAGVNPPKVSFGLKPPVEGTGGLGGRFNNTSAPTPARAMAAKKGVMTKKARGEA